MQRRRSLSAKEQTKPFKWLWGKVDRPLVQVETGYSDIWVLTNNQSLTHVLWWMFDRFSSTCMFGLEVFTTSTSVMICHDGWCVFQQHVLMISDVMMCHPTCRSNARSSCRKSSSFWPFVRPVPPCSFRWLAISSIEWEGCWPPYKLPFCGKNGLGMAIL